ncbi:uncharacterized protein BDR25DRAFT_131751 [Lindgomyces ingoldianus]|uniref:Uncharacterized protein n=1 Tax=Lindgomyces ingoldianus TaxID=673940 RepID=A0ACB6R2W9_9PLEO|nr:uncharacterized protein BDR25DRAFT_131751 [Lindgomyces ingoldianus]KAF2473402.1 hypothetical protein BDR25DRAFT_131751 [Lindgomyces ingoldianus]
MPAPCLHLGFPSLSTPIPNQALLASPSIIYQMFPSLFSACRLIHNPLHIPPPSTTLFLPFHLHRPIRRPRNQATQSQRACQTSQHPFPKHRPNNIIYHI